MNSHESPENQIIYATKYGADWFWLLLTCTMVPGSSFPQVTELTKKIIMTSLMIA